MYVYVARMPECCGSGMETQHSGTQGHINIHYMKYHLFDLLVVYATTVLKFKHPLQEFNAT
jgi:hypothetical protein